MKKSVIIGIIATIILAGMMGCIFIKESEGEIKLCEDVASRNAKQFVLEKIKEVAPLQVEDVDHIEIVSTDSVISTVMVHFNYHYALRCINEEKYDEAGKLLQSFDTIFSDMKNSVLFGCCDSLLHIDRYRDEFRAMYRCEIVMKSGITKSCDVIMDNDNITPRCTGAEYIKEISELSENVYNSKQMLRTMQEDNYW